MKVDFDKQATVSATSASTVPRTSGSEAARPVAGAQDRASLTVVASDLATKATIDVPAEASSARIAALKAAILAGALRIDPEMLAQSMLDDEAPLE